MEPNPTIQDLEDCFEEAKASDSRFIAVVIMMPNFEQPELIINQNENFDDKLEYYKKAYNDDLTLKTFNQIKIVGFDYGNYLEDFEHLI